MKAEIWITWLENTPMDMIRAILGKKPKTKQYRGLVIGGGYMPIAGSYYMAITETGELRPVSKSQVIEMDGFSPK